MVAPSLSRLLCPLRRRSPQPSGLLLAPRRCVRAPSPMPEADFATAGRAFECVAFACLGVGSSLSLQCRTQGKAQSTADWEGRERAERRGRQLLVPQRRQRHSVWQVNLKCKWIANHRFVTKRPQQVSLAHPSFSHSQLHLHLLVHVEGQRRGF